MRDMRPRLLRFDEAPGCPRELLLFATALVVRKSALLAKEIAGLDDDGVFFVYFLEARRMPTKSHLSCSASSGLGSSMPFSVLQARISVSSR